MLEYGKKYASCISSVQDRIEELLWHCFQNVNRGRTSAFIARALCNISPEAIIAIALNVIAKWSRVKSFAIGHIKTSKLMIKIIKTTATIEDMTSLLLRLIERVTHVAYFSI